MRHVDYVISRLHDPDFASEYLRETIQELYSSIEDGREAIAVALHRIAKAHHCTEELKGRLDDKQ